MKSTCLGILISVIVLTGSTYAAKASSTIRDSHRVKAIQMLQQENEHVRAFSGFVLTNNMKETSVLMAENLDLPIYDSISEPTETISESYITDDSIQETSYSNTKDGPSFSDIASNISQRHSSKLSKSPFSKQNLVVMITDKP